MANHVAGGLKQRNKKHKAGHASKRALKRDLGAGKVETGAKQRGAVKPSASRPQISSKQLRKNRDEQLRKVKRSEQWLERRLGTKDGPPKVVGLFALSPTADVERVLELVLEDAQQVLRPEESVANALGPMVTCTFPTHKQRFTFLLAHRNVGSLLEVAKVADVLVGVVDTQSADGGWLDEDGQLLLTALRTQGVPSCVGVIQGLEHLPVKAFGEAKKEATAVLQHELGEEIKIAEAHNKVQLMRALTTTSPNSIHWRSIRSYLLAYHVELDTDVDESGCAMAKVYGFLRGRPLNVNQLVHLPDVGTVQIESILSASDPCPLKSQSHLTRLADNTVVAAPSPEEQETLDTEAVAEGIAADMYIPTEDDVYHIQKTGGDFANAPKNIRVTDGMSEHMARWLQYAEEMGEADGDEDEAEDGSDDDGDEENGQFGMDGNFGEDDDGSEGKNSEHGEMGPPIGLPRWQQDADDDDGSLIGANSIAALDEPISYEEMLARKKAARDDEMFPDEVDTPADQPARTRFQRYRALQSFRTSPWHPKENLPPDYARIFQFENYTALQRRFLAEGRAMEHAERLAISAPSASATTAGETSMGFEGSAQESANPYLIPQHEDYLRSGVFVCLVLRKVPVHALTERTGLTPLSLFSLLPYENKLSVLHASIVRTNNYQEPIKSKDRLLFQVGARKWWTKPLFSQQTFNSEKQKFDRFFQQDRFTCATFFGLTTYQPAPVVVYKQMEDGSLVMVATGVLTSVNPDRIVLKKVMLTGYPVRARKRFAVVKYMFFDPLDVKYFQPAELVTKHGLRGHIKESVGTHGLMKVTFNAPIKQHDTVCLNLYKRVFPKFPEEGRVAAF